MKLNKIEENKAMIESIEIQYLGSVLGVSLWEVRQIFKTKRERINNINTIYKGVSYKRALKIARAQRTETNCPSLVVRGQG
tara:strand:- start:1074 stop:1316 length:243 start_codon:yes stop_codon:yes gene_type:complete